MPEIRTPDTIRGEGLALTARIEDLRRDRERSLREARVLADMATSLRSSGEPDAAARMDARAADWTADADRMLAQIAEVERERDALRREYAALTPETD